MFNLLHGKHGTELAILDSSLKDPSIESANVVNITDIADDNTFLITWIHTVRKFCALASTSATRLRLLIVWLTEIYLPTSTREICSSTLHTLIPSDWTLQYVLYNAVDSSDSIDANRCVF